MCRGTAVLRGQDVKAAAAVEWRPGTASIHCQLDIVLLYPGVHLFSVEDEIVGLRQTGMNRLSGPPGTGQLSMLHSYISRTWSTVSTLT